ncbi:SMP-30/gluconolactonase/LRE family protein [Hyphococcus lacteus]|uniref:SMP-30/gluconolactonase/LRE family protein n=1 Tax=Hyphococcus lacteus TaxID=3143536 RepID=A0ABV3ZBH0_9PROT
MKFGIGLLALCLSASCATITPLESMAPLELSDVGFHHSEAARYDPVSDRYFVSNLGARGTENDGFISIVDPTGTVNDLRWIAGGVDGVELYEPLGMYVKGDVLYVADITAVRMFDRVSGTSIGAIQIEGATRPNDLAVDNEGTIFLTDSGGDETPGALYRISPSGEVTYFVQRSDDLVRPNGVAITTDGQVVHGGLLGDELIYRDRATASIISKRRLPTGRIDGIVALADGSLLVASQNGHNVYHVPSNSEKTPVIVADGIDVPAAIGFDTKRGRVLIPQIRKSSVTVVEVVKNE